MSAYRFRDKVWCWYHPPYPAAKCGTVLFRWPWRKPHLFSNGPCDWYVVLRVNWRIALQPETCMKSIADAIKEHDEWLPHRFLKTPADVKAAATLDRWQIERIKFAQT